MTPEDWIAHDPDPVTAAELSRCDQAELAARFARPLTFGTAGLRGPVRGGPDAMNLAVVLRASWALASVLSGRGLRRLDGDRRPRRTTRVGAVRQGGRRSDCRRGVFGRSCFRSRSHARAGVRGSAHRRRGRYPDHRVSQPADRQRLQGLSRRRDPDRLPHRPGDRDCDGERTIRRRDRQAAGRTGGHRAG